MNDWDGAPTASIVLVTFNRIGMLRKCVSAILENTLGVAYELVVWDNASTDGTAEYLDVVASANPQVRVIHSLENIGLNGVAAGVRAARGFYLVEMDDDVIDVPSGWLAEMIRSFDAVPRAGYLAANVVQDDLTDGAKLSPAHYTPIDFGDGVIVEFGPLGGWCSITSADVVADIGNFLEIPGRIFFGEDNDFIGRCLLEGYRVGIVRSVVVFHAAGAIANAMYGCLDVCKLKYSDDPGYAPYLRHTLEVEAGERTETQVVATLPRFDGDASPLWSTRHKVSVTSQRTPPLDEKQISKALRLADRCRGPIVAELRLKRQFSIDDYKGARLLLWQCRSLNPDPFRRGAMLVLGIASPRLLARRWRRLAHAQNA